MKLLLLVAFSGFCIPVSARQTLTVRIFIDTVPLFYIPKIGDPVHKRVLTRPPGPGVVISAAQMTKAYTALYLNTVLTIGYNKGRINFISTKSGTIIPEKIEGSITIAELKARYPGISLIKEAGWAYYYRLPSGWNAIVHTESANPTVRAPVDADRISGYFKR